MHCICLGSLWNFWNEHKFNKECVDVGWMNSENSEVSKPSNGEDLQTLWI